MLNYQLTLNGINVAVALKNIKNLNIRIYPPSGDVRVSAPLCMDAERIKNFVLSRMAWIKKHREKILATPRAPVHEFIDMETHYVWGQPRQLRIHAHGGNDRVELEADTLHVFLRRDAVKKKMAAMLRNWHRELVLEEGGARIEYWRGIFGLPPMELAARAMKSRWGSCMPLKNKIVLNTELAVKPRVCIDYVAAHELAHFFVPNHGDKFKLFMDRHFPDWRQTRRLLNSMPRGL